MQWLHPRGRLAGVLPLGGGGGGACLGVGVVAVQGGVPLLAGQDAVVGGGQAPQPAVYPKACRASEREGQVAPTSALPCQLNSAPPDGPASKDSF